MDTSKMDPTTRRKLEHLCDVWRRLEANRSRLEAINICIISAFFGVCHYVDLIGSAYNVTYNSLDGYMDAYGHILYVLCVFMYVFCIPCTTGDAVIYR